MSTRVAEELYKASENTYDSFIELLIYLTKDTSVDSRQIKILIKLNYFDMFGHSGLLLKLYDEFLNGEFRYKTSYVEKTLAIRIAKLIDLENEFRSKGVPELLPNDVVMTQLEHMGYADVRYPKINSSWCVVTDINTKYSPKLYLYSVKKGESKMFKMDRKTFNVKDKTLKINRGDLIEITEHKKKSNKFQMEMVDTLIQTKWKYGLQDIQNTFRRRLRMQTNFDKLSKPSIEKLVKRQLSDNEYIQVVSEVLLNLLETNRYE